MASIEEDTIKGMRFRDIEGGRVSLRLCMAAARCSPIWSD